MTKTYTQTIFPSEVTKKSGNNTVRLDDDDQLFYDMLKSELDALLRQPQSGIINKITLYSRSLRTPLM